MAKRKPGGQPGNKNGRGNAGKSRGGSSRGGSNRVTTVSRRSRRGTANATRGQRVAQATRAVPRNTVLAARGGAKIGAAKTKRAILTPQGRAKSKTKLGSAVKTAAVGYSLYRAGQGYAILGGALLGRR